MKIGIDTFSCDHGRSGIGAYLLSLVKNLPESDTSFELFGYEFDRYTYNTDAEKIPFTGLALADSDLAERIWHFLGIQSFLKKNGYNAVLYPAGGRILPLSFKTPGVAVINDIMSQMVHRTDDFWFNLSVKHSLRKATRIIAGSNFIRKDLIKLKIDPDKIEVIYNGIDHDLFYPREQFEGDTVLIKPFAIKKPYLLYPSRIHFPSKKHVELIRAFAYFKSRTGLPHRLVIAGANGKHAEIIQHEARISPYSSDILLTGHFPHENMPELYSSSDGCVFPSVSEGVGLPVLEAMATGVPVACSKAGSLPEVAGDNAFYFDPDNIEETALAIEKLVTRNDMREKMISGGLEWTKRFSWDKTATKTVAVLKKIIAGRK